MDDDVVEVSMLPLRRACTIAPVLGALVLGVSPAPAFASPGKFGDPVKKAPSGICYPPSNSEWGALKKFTPFKTMDDCLKTGGRLPPK